jgi:competence protein ComEC
MRNALVVMAMAGWMAAAPAAAPGSAHAPAQAAASARDQARPGGKPLQIFFIDVEGGQATLIVSPSGESLLVDAGWPGFEGRDADRIAAAAKQAGLSRIDYLVVTHYHTDHVGGVPAIAAKLPIGTFVDHGESVEHGEQPDKLYRAYLEVRDKGRHLLVKPGDTIPIKGLDVRVVTAAGEHIATPLAPAAKAGGSAAGSTPNALCGAFTPKEADPSENARSVGIVVTLDRFRFVDLGDLTWNKEHDLVCPNNLLGPVDLYLTTHHGLNASNAPVLVHAIRPRVAVMNNGAKKGGSPEAWQTVHDSPGLLDLWQVHYAVAGGADHNVAESFIANMDETTGNGITVAAQRDGSFTVTNTRNGNSKHYPARYRAERQARRVASSRGDSTRG